MFDDTDQLSDKDLEFLSMFDDIMKKDRDSFKDRDHEGPSDETKSDFSEAPDDHGFVENADRGEDEFLFGELELEFKGEGDGNGQGEGQAEGSEGEQEGQDGKGESEGENDSENDSEGDESKSETKPECSSDCKPSDDDSGDEHDCPYCREKFDRQQERQSNKDNGNDFPLGLDANGDEIFVGDEIVSRGDGELKKDIMYTGLVLGTSFAHNLDALENSMLVVMRRDDPELGDYFIEADDRTAYWGVRSSFTILIEKSENDSEDDKPEDKGQKDQKEQDDEQQEEGERPPMTKVQKERFDTLCKRIHKKSEATFGKTSENVVTGFDAPGGIFDDEEISRTLTLSSRGVTYRVTVSAEREVN